MKQTLSIIGLCVILLAAYNSITPSTSVATHYHSNSYTQASDTVDTVQRSPSLSSKFIDHILCKASSPACGTGESLYNYGVVTGIDPAIALAFFQHESKFGLYGVAHNNKGIGNIRCTYGYRCFNGFRAYTTWQAGYQDWYHLIKDGYINGSVSNQCPCTTISTIIPVYAPSTENDIQGYITAVTSAVTKWRAEAAQ